VKKFFWFKIFPILVLIGVLVLLNKYSWQGDDISILSINNDKVEIISVSPDRGVVNDYTVENVDLWIPNGMGWYPVSRAGLIVKNDENLAKKIAFYNFGFWPKLVIINEKWDSNQSLLSHLGPVGFLRYKLSTDNWLWKKDTLKMQNLAEIMPRDMADNKVIFADIKLNIVNATGKNGFGNMIADRLEWWGAMVTSVQTRDVENKSRLYFDFKSKEAIYARELATIFGCEAQDRAGGIELVLGTELEEVLKYSQTYVRSF